MVDTSIREKSVVTMARGMLLAVTLVAVACGSSTGPEDEGALEGVWTWIESTGGIAGTTRTPASTGETLELRFLESGSVEVWRNGELSATTGYLFTAETESDPARVAYSEPVFGFETQDVRFEGEDVLILTDPCCDGFVNRFERMSG